MLQEQGCGCTEAEMQVDFIKKQFFQNQNATNELWEASAAVIVQLWCSFFFTDEPLHRG